MHKLIWAQLSRRKKAYIATCVEIVILIVVTNILMNRLIPFVQGEKLFKESSLHKIVCCTSSADESHIASIASTSGATLLWQNFKSETISGTNITVQPVSLQYFNRILSSNSAYSYGEIIAVIPSNLSRQYHQDCSYSLFIDGMESPIKIHVVHTLANNIMFIPPSSDAASSIISNRPNTILIGIPETMVNYFRLSNIFTLDVGINNPDNVVQALLNSDSISAAMSAYRARDYSNSLDIEMMGMPIIIAVTSVFLCFTGLLSSTLLSIYYNERINCIYYICGYTWAKCALIQIICDLLIIFSAIVISLVILLYLTVRGGSIVIYNDSFTISIAIVFFLYIFSEVVGITQIRKADVAELVEGIK